MDTHALVELLRDGPDEELIRAVGDVAQDSKGIVPLLDAELKRSASRLQRLKGYRNRLISPMYRLEPELLSRIMFIYAHDNDELYNLRWTRLIFVCRRWHDVAMHALKLWSFIEVVAPDTVKSLTMTPQKLYARDIRRVESQRSRVAHSPLSIKMSVGQADLYEGKTAFMSMFDWHPSSLSSLILTAKAEYVEPIARILATHRHGILRNLEVRCGDCTVATLATLRPSLDVAFQNNLPQLSHLAIDVTFDWALLRGLRSLRVLFGNYRNDTAGLSLTFTLWDIVDALARCPLLEDLEIRLPHSFAHDAASAVFPVSLPYLDTAFIQAALNVCSEFLGALSGSPNTAKMFVCATNTSDDLPTLSRLSSFLGTHASNEGAPVIQSLVMARHSRLGAPGAQRTAVLIMIGRTNTARLDGSAATLSSWSVTTRRTHTTSSHIGFEASIADPVIESEALTNTLRSWPLSQVTHLDLRSMRSTQNPLHIILAEVPAVTSVVVRPESSVARELIESLQLQLREYGRRALAHVAFDASYVRDTQLGELAGLMANPLLPSTATARETMMRMVLYCKEAASAGVAMDAIELYDEPSTTRHRLMDPEERIDWSELYSDLRYGFVYEGVLHSGKAEYDGRDWNSFECDDET